jgi:hypothetical protein
MRFSHILSTLTASLVSVRPVGGVPSPVYELSPRQAESCNTPTNRACWTTGFTIDTDYEIETPYTGVTREVN